MIEPTISMGILPFGFWVASTQLVCHQFNEDLLLPHMTDSTSQSQGGHTFSFSFFSAWYATKARGNRGDLHAPWRFTAVPVVSVRSLVCLLSISERPFGHSSFLFSHPRTRKNLCRTYNRSELIFQALASRSIYIRVKARIRTEAVSNSGRSRDWSIR